MQPPRRRQIPSISLLPILAQVLMGLLLAVGCATSERTVPGKSSLKDAARGKFAMGVGISDRIPERPSDWTLLTNQFDTITPENCMKPDPVQVTEGRFAFARPDAFTAFGSAHGLRVVGHCLVLAKDDRTPSWFFRDGTNTAGRELLLTRMKKHIDTVAGCYRGRIAEWDVVNEALDDGTNYLRPSGWSKACGEEFVAQAFIHAHLLLEPPRRPELAERLPLEPRESPAPLRPRRPAEARL